MGLFPGNIFLPEWIIIITALTDFFLTQNVVQGHLNSTIRRGSRNAEDFVPIRPIIGTNLFTGIYYKLGIKRFPKGWVTWTEKNNEQEGWNYVQIDARSDHMVNYEKSGEWYNDIQWFFVQSESDKGWYTLRNRQLPDALATWSKSEPTGESSEGYHIILNRKADSTHADSMWKPVLAVEKGQGTNTEYFHLRIKSLPNGIVTWTWKEYEGKDSHYIQVDSGDSLNPSVLKNYQPNNDWYVDTLFTIEKIESELVGEITQLEMLLFPKLDLVRSLTYMDCESVTGTIFINVESTPLSAPLKQNIVNHGELTLKFQGPLSQLPFLTISASTGQISPPWYADSIEFQMVRSEYFTNEDIKLKTVEHGSINTNIIIPPWSSTEVRVCREFIDTSKVDVDIEVYIFLAISEKSYRPSNDEKKFEAVYAMLPVNEFTHQSVNSLLNFSKIVNLDERSGMPAKLGVEINYSDVEENDFKILGNRESEVVIILPGTISGKFGYRGVVASN